MRPALVIDLPLYQAQHGDAGPGALWGFGWRRLGKVGEGWLGIYVRFALNLP